jgi:hypothetical protein
MNLQEHHYPFASYEPVKQRPHARRVKQLAGASIFARLKTMYENDGEFRLQTDLLLGVTASAVGVIAVITILLMVAMKANL